MSFNHTGKYICECGKEFTSSQSFNGHKGHCKVHLQNKGTYEDYLKQQREKAELARIVSTKNKKERSEQKKLKAKIEWESTTHYCERCGKELPHKYEDRYATGRFCSRSCANSKDHTLESRNRISLALKGRGVSDEKKFCKICGKELLRRNTSGYCRECISSAPERHELRVNVGKKVAQKVKEQGNGKYWQSRNIQSYPEKFWETVLVNNNISFEGPNKPVKKGDGKNNYFLDFYIEKGNYKIDLEIDGKQHTYSERIESDKVRDAYIKSLGYIVYRIPWNEINSESGKLKMQDKINSFISFYKHL